MKRYEKFLLIAALDMILSIASTLISFLDKVSYEWTGDRRDFVIIQYGFPYGWYTEFYGGLIRKTTHFHSEPFIVDTIIYIIMYSIIAMLTRWPYRLFAFKSQDKSLIKP